MILVLFTASVVQSTHIIVFIGLPLFMSHYVQSHLFTAQLRLEGNDLTGSLPSELGKLELMSELYLGDNTLTSTIPAALKSMRSLRVLSLKNNKLSGSIPMEISELNDLVKLQLTGNILEGSVPREVCALGLDRLQVDSSVECSCC